MVFFMKVHTREDIEDMRDETLLVIYDDLKVAAALSAAEELDEPKVLDATNTPLV